MATRKGKAKASLSDAVIREVRAAIESLPEGERIGLFIPHLDKIRRATALEFDPASEETYAALLESICGMTDDSQPVEQYDGTLGVSIAFVNAHQGAVGQLQWNNNLATLYTNPGNVSGVRWCSGTMISNDLFLTAGHCFDQTGGGWTRPVDNTTGTTISNAEIATNMHVNFNYQVDPAGNLRAEQSFAVTSLVEYRLGGLDFAIARLAGNPGATFGTTGVSTTDAAVGDMLAIIGHPAGWPKRIEAGATQSVAGTSISYNDIDTLGGNSGSGVLRASDGRIVGVHTNGGCNAQGTGANSGVRITSIIAQSPTLRALTAPKRKFADEHVTLKFIDEPPKLKFRDDHATLKFADDPKLKFADDVVTRPALDMPTTTKAIDDVKQPALDKQFSDHKLPAQDLGGPMGRIPGPGPVTPIGPAPFVVSTPHHSMEWMREESRAAAAHLESAIVEMQGVMQHRLSELAELDGQYRSMLAQYEELMRGLG